ncbi:MAG: 30S ribosomal protein S6 [Candidatus Aminicenantes bacterium]|jgi:small subunit ribosomal protein S6
MTSYETAFLIAPNLPEEETEKLIEKMAGIISKKKGKMINLDRWGKRKLAYPIQRFEEAFYVFFQYHGEPVIPTELERNFKQSEAVIRYLTIKMEESEIPRRKKAAAPKASGKKGSTLKKTETKKESAEKKPEEEKSAAAAVETKDEEIPAKDKEEVSVENKKEERNG